LEIHFLFSTFKFPNPYAEIISAFCFLNFPIFLMRNLNRRLARHSTRMLGGARRPRQPNYLLLACRALSELIKIDARLRPFMEEQQRMLEQDAWNQECEAALRKVYGPPKADAPPPLSAFFTSVPTPAQIRLQERALAKSQFVLACIQAQLQHAPRIPGGKARSPCAPAQWFGVPASAGGVG
jgi:hypothetical protein